MTVSKTVRLGSTPSRYTKPGGLYTFHHQAPHFQTMEAIMAEQPVIHVKVKPDLSEMKTLLHEIIDCIDNYEQQGNENRES